MKIRNLLKITNVKRNGKKETWVNRAVGEEEKVDHTQDQVHPLLKGVESNMQMKRRNFILNKLPTTISLSFKTFSNRSRSILSKGKKS